VTTIGSATSFITRPAVEAARDDAHFRPGRVIKVDRTGVFLTRSVTCRAATAPGAGRLGAGCGRSARLAVLDLGTVDEH